VIHIGLVGSHHSEKEYLLHKDWKLSNKLITVDLWSLNSKSLPKRKETEGAQTQKWLQFDMRAKQELGIEVQSRK
tara:strand:+ start:302 stop:526 length:225 start_codon:yes stop_codon:yes gene_type:complete